MCLDYIKAFRNRMPHRLITGRTFGYKYFNEPSDDAERHRWRSCGYLQKSDTLRPTDVTYHKIDNKTVNYSYQLDKWYKANTTYQLGCDVTGVTYKSGFHLCIDPNPRYALKRHAQRYLIEYREPICWGNQGGIDMVVAEEMRIVCRAHTMYELWKAKGLHAKLVMEG